MGIEEHRIKRVRLRAREIAELEHFYTGNLGLPLLPPPQGPNVGKGAFAVLAGVTRLEFIDAETDGPAPVHHFAFGIPQNMVNEALAWARPRVTLLRDASGDEIVHFQNWNAHAFYFQDPAGNILECIGRHGLPDHVSGTFHAGLIRSVNEVGVVVPDDIGVPNVVSYIQRSTGLPVYGTVSDDFAAVGDERGLLVIVRECRPWFMAEHVLASIEETEVVFAGESNVDAPIAGLPLMLKTSKDA
jgi:catechol 2,3-dioxygenase-like lactoylglutathione lyase family enzyme